MGKMKKIGKLYGEEDKRGDMKSGSKASGKAAFALLLAGTLLLALAFLPQPALAQTAVTTCAELQNIKDNLGGNYYLANDIDCSGFGNFEPIGTESSKFTGTFDGKGYKITNLYINRPSTDNVGLFGFTGSGSEIKDVGLEEVDVSGDGCVGGLVGFNDGPITNSYSSGSVSGSCGVGGLVGYKRQGTITNSYSSGSVSGSWNVGGLVGINEGTITNSYSTGSVTGSNYVGGLVGDNVGTITNCYWDIYRSGRSDCVGVDKGTTTCTGKNSGNSEPDYWYFSTHAPMDQWDFVNIWAIEEGVTYPYLQWQEVAEPPSITSFAPPSPVSDTVCTWRTFNISVDQTVNVSWYLNKSLLPGTNESKREANYTLHAEFVGDNNVSAVAENANGTDMQTWVWNVAIPLNCTCGDICVNTTGWWRNNSFFNVSGIAPIQAAVDNANAGETICVKDGTYNENVDVDVAHLTIQSQNGSDSTTVQAESADDHIFNVTKDYVNISGFTATGATNGGNAGIYLNSSVSNCNISDNNASHNVFGIYLPFSCNNNTLANNTANLNSAFGIYLPISCNNNTLANNTANLNSAYGILLESSCNNNTLTGNTANLNGVHGIVVEGWSNNNTLTGNTANSNTQHGIYLWYSGGNNTLTKNTANSNGHVGIYLEGSSDNTLTENAALKNDWGIMLHDTSNNNTLTNNTANSNNNNGINLLSSSNNTLTNNTANSNTQYGIRMLSSNSTNLTGNTANSNDDYGIYLSSSSNNTLMNNTASNNTNYDFYSDQNSHDNNIEDLLISSYPTTISFTYDNGIRIKGVTTPEPDPMGKVNISKFVNATNVTADSWMFMNVSYEDGDLGGVDENSLKMWKHNGTDWTEVQGTNGVNTTGNYVYANVTSFSQIAPFGNPPDATPPGNVTGFTATAGDGQVSLSWTNPGDADFVGTKVIRKQGSYPTNVNDGTEVCNRTKAPGSTDSYTDTGLTNGIAYYYTAFAYDGVPNYSSADDSARDYATPTAPTPPVPVPEFNTIGLLALIGILSVVLAFATLRKRE